MRDTHNFAHSLSYDDGLLTNHEVHEGETALDREQKLLRLSVGGVEPTTAWIASGTH
jgi:hypothetical protein